MRKTYFHHSKQYLDRVLNPFRYPGKNVVRSIKKFNSKGVLKAYSDPKDPNHIFVTPVDERLLHEWIVSRPDADLQLHQFTSLLKSISTIVVYP